MQDRIVASSVWTAAGMIAIGSGVFALTAVIIAGVHAWNGPVRGVSFLLCFSSALAAVAFGATAGYAVAVLGAVYFVVSIAPGNGLSPEPISLLVCLFSMVGLVWVIDQRRDSPTPIRSRLVHPWLPFVSQSDDGSRSWWTTTETSYLADCEAGRAMARDLMFEIRRTNAPHLLAFAVQDMLKAGRFSGAEAGFCSEIGLLIAHHDADNPRSNGHVVEALHNGSAASIGDDQARPEELAEHPESPAGGIDLDHDNVPVRRPGNGVG